MDVWCTRAQKELRSKHIKTSNGHDGACGALPAACRQKRCIRNMLIYKARARAESESWAWARRPTAAGVWSYRQRLTSAQVQPLTKQCRNHTFHAQTFNTQ